MVFSTLSCFNPGSEGLVEKSPNRWDGKGLCRWTDAKNITFLPQCQNGAERTRHWTRNYRGTSKALFVNRMQTGKSSKNKTVKILCLLEQGQPKSFAEPVSSISPDRTEGGARK